MLRVHGEHQCGKQCISVAEEDFDAGPYEEVTPEDASKLKLKQLAPVKTSRARPSEKSFKSRMSSSLVPRPVDVIKQLDDDSLLPQISITNKRLTQMEPSTKK